MAGTHLAFTLLMLAGLEDIQANLNPHGGTMNAKPLLDPKRRSEIVDEAFLEQKDILLEMLETKLKEVRDKRKRKSLNNFDGNNTNNIFDKVSDKHLENVDVKMIANGISAVGDTNLELKYGTGKGLVYMDAHGISNIGSAHVEVGVGETGLFIPGLTGLFVGSDRGHINASKNVSVNGTSTEAPATEKVDNSRRSGNKANLNETTATLASNLTNATTLVTANANHTIITDTATPVKNSTVQVWNTPDALHPVMTNATVTAATNATT